MKYNLTKKILSLIHGFNLLRYSVHNIIFAVVTGPVYGPLFVIHCRVVYLEGIFYLADFVTLLRYFVEFIRRVGRVIRYLTTVLASSQPDRKKGFIFAFRIKFRMAINNFGSLNLLTINRPILNKQTLLNWILVLRVISAGSTMSLVWLAMSGDV